jgi:LacI family transcriptional regulator
MTIKDLSAQTGYSVGTVSRVLNNQPNVSEKARKVIQEAAEASGFQLNANAKQLKQSHSNSVLVVVKGTSNEMFSGLVETIQACMAETSYQLMVDYIDENSNEVLRALQLCRERKPLGIVFLGGNREHFVDSFRWIEVPCVLVTNNAEGLGFKNLSSVSSDDVLAGRTAIEQLVSLGHRKIAVIGGNLQASDISRLRYQGCMDAFQAHGISFDPEQDYEGIRYSFEEGYRAAKRLLGKNRQFSAIFAASDVMAIGAIRALKDAGLRVPEDMSVIGFDGLAIGAYTVPTLSTVQQNVDAMARRSVEMLLENIQSGQLPRYETVPFDLELRESTREN